MGDPDGRRGLAGALNWQVNFAYRYQDQPSTRTQRTCHCGSGRSISTAVSTRTRRRTRRHGQSGAEAPAPPSETAAAPHGRSRRPTSPGSGRRPIAVSCSVRACRGRSAAAVSSGAIRDVRHLRRGCARRSAVPSNRSDFRTKTAVRMMPSPRRSAASAAHPPAASRAARQSPG